jgi:hypothetical protein
MIPTLPLPQDAHRLDEHNTVSMRSRIAPNALAMAPPTART